MGKEITRTSVIALTIGMVIGNIILAAMVSHDWHAAIEISFFQIVLGITIIVAG